MTEAVLKSALVSEIRLSLPKFVVFRHEDRFTHGIPDISITGNYKTSWFEAKYADPDLHSKGIQELTMLRLARTGFAFYLVYFYDPKEKEKMTYIVPPTEISSPRFQWGISFSGFDHKGVVNFIQELHK